MPLFYYRVRDIISPMSRSNRGCRMIARYLQFLPLHSPRSPGDLTRPQSGHPLMKLLLETEGVSETDSEGVSESETSEDPIVVEVGTYFDIGPNFYDAVFLPQLNATRIPARRVSASSPLPAGIIQGSSSVSPVGDGGKCDVVRGIPAGYHAVGACAVAEFGIPLFVVRLVSARPERGVATGEAVCGVVVIGEESGVSSTSSTSSTSSVKSVQNASEVKVGVKRVQQASISASSLSSSSSPSSSQSPLLESNRWLVSASRLTRFAQCRYSFFLSHVPSPRGYSPDPTRARPTAAFPPIRSFPPRRPPTTRPRTLPRELSSARRRRAFPPRPNRRPANRRQCNGRPQRPGKPGKNRGTHEGVQS